MSKSGFSLQFESSLFFDSQAAASLASGGLLGVAVSGGADSLALLTALLHRFGADRLRVITVNHNMRPEAETAGDAAFVASYCASAGLSCTTVTLERGLVARRARERGKGSEEAARSLRYEAFERFIRQEGLTALCLAHNRNDQLETLVMRFLQGSASGGGIAYRRGPFIRPLLALSRESIERYLKEQGLSWRTDATNADTRYLRNAIRRQLLPMLDRLYPGWDGAVLSGAEKAGEDDAVLEALASSFSWEKAPDGSCCTMPASVFYGQSPALRRRLFYRALTDLGFDKRFPYGLVRAACSSDFFSVEGAAPRGGRELTAMGITFGIKKEMLFVKKEQNRATESGFLGILSAVGETCTLFDRIFSAEGFR